MKGKGWVGYQHNMQCQSRFGVDGYCPHPRKNFHGVCPLMANYLITFRRWEPCRSCHSIHWEIELWQPLQDSNLCMTGSKPVALPAWLRGIKRGPCNYYSSRSSCGLRGLFPRIQRPFHHTTGLMVCIYNWSVMQDLNQRLLDSKAGALPD